MKSLARRCIPLAVPLVAGLGSAAQAETYDTQVYWFCEEITCGGYLWSSDVDDIVNERLEEVNLQFRPISAAHPGISYRPLPTKIIVDPVLSQLTGASGWSKKPGVKNKDIIADIKHDYIDPYPGRVTIVLTPNVGPTCWNGIPCPGGDASNSDNAVFCNTESPGSNLAHELGHYWGLEHTFTKQDIGQLDKYGLPIAWPDHNGDDDPSHCPLLGAITDTPADPNGLESQDKNQNKLKDDAQTKASDDTSLTMDQIWSGNDRVYRPNHDFCLVTKHDAPEGSVHGKYCTIECSRVEPNQDLVPIQFTPLTENAMSYYSGCKGPLLDDNGDTKEAFTPQQVTRMEIVRVLFPRRAQLVDVCAPFGGDSDHDGWCDSGPQRDLCPNQINTRGNQDSDGDGTGDACDLCPEFFGPTDDFDHDGVGDVCDWDFDNDGCDDFHDQHPFSAYYEYANSLCGDDPQMASEAWDFDKDGLKNCEDKDDDGDKIPDDQDECPSVSAIKRPDVHGPTCGIDFSEVCQPLKFCKVGECDKLSVKVASVIGGYSAKFDSFEYHDGDLYLRPITGLSLAESLQALRGVWSQGGARREREELRISVIDDESGRELGDLGRYVPEDLSARLTRGQFLRVTPGERGAPPTVRVVWVIGAEAGEAPDDLDGDGVPRFADNCIDEWNPGQSDVDGDKNGDACDGDNDGDGFVGERDLELVAECLGVSVEDPTECGEEVSSRDDGDERADDDWEARKSLGDELGFTAHCRPADLDGDDFVGERDLELVRYTLDAAVGPSGLLPPGPCRDACRD